MTLYEELTWRGLIKDVSNEEKARSLLDEQKTKFYCGFDPTGESLTIGHLVQIVRIILLQNHGHMPIVLIGGATGLIGDPRENSERKLLTLEESLFNAKKIENQLSSFIDPNKALFVNNYDWLKNIDMISYLRDYGKHFSVNYMKAKDTVQKRLDIGISYTEFSYMLIQAIDFLHLYQEYDCKLQFGGSDQWGNITTGLEMIRKVEGDKNTAVGMSSPLLLKADGTKFGKSESGALWLDKGLTSAYKVYQHLLNVSDLDVINYLKNLTLLPVARIKDLEQEMKKAPELRAAQIALASSVVELMHGKKELAETVQVSKALFSGDFTKLGELGFKMLKKTLETVDLDEEMQIVDVLINTKLASSKREAREFVKNGSIRVNQEKIKELEFIVNKDSSFYKKYVVIRRGKKKYAMVNFI